MLDTTRDIVAAPPRNQHESTWTNAQIDRLRALWVEGKSGTEVAVLLNTEFGMKYTRNAIIGKANREGMLSDNHRAGGRLKGCEGNRGRRVAKEAIPDITDFSIPFAQRKTLMELSGNDCRWPVGDPCEPGFFFCGGKTSNESPYCVSHSKRAYGYVREPRCGGFKI